MIGPDSLQRQGRQNQDVKGRLQPHRYTLQCCSREAFHTLVVSICLDYPYKVPREPAPDGPTGSSKSVPRAGFKGLVHRVKRRRHMCLASICFQRGRAIWLRLEAPVRFTELLSCCWTALGSPLNVPDCCIRPMAHIPRNTKSSDSDEEGYEPLEPGPQTAVPKQYTHIRTPNARSSWVCCRAEHVLCEGCQGRLEVTLRWQKSL